MIDLPKICAKAAEEIATAGHFGWGNVCLDAGVRIAELEAQAKASEWQPISTAPKIGAFTVYVPDHSFSEIQTCYRNKNGVAVVGGSFEFDLRNPPTHWMPLPAPPKSTCESA